MASVVIAVTAVVWPEKGRDTTYNEETVAVMRRVLSPMANAVDVGAYRGELTGPMLELAPQGTHYVIEPQPAFARQLRKRFPGAHVLELAAGDHDGTATFVLALDSPARSGFREQEYPTPDERTDTIVVRVARLDDLIPATTPVAFIKIDVEGAEYMVLTGATELIRRDRPVIVFEYGRAGIDNYGTTPQMMWTLLHDELGFEVSLMRRWLDGKRPLSREEFLLLGKSWDEWMYVAYPPRMRPPPK